MPGQSSLVPVPASPLAAAPRLGAGDRQTPARVVDCVCVSVCGRLFAASECVSPFALWSGALPDSSGRLSLSLAAIHKQAPTDSTPHRARWGSPRAIHELEPPHLVVMFGHVIWVQVALTPIAVLCLLLAASRAVLDLAVTHHILLEPLLGPVGKVWPEVGRNKGADKAQALRRVVEQLGHPAEPGAGRGTDIGEGVARSSSAVVGKLPPDGATAVRRCWQLHRASSAVLRAAWLLPQQARTGPLRLHT